MINRRRLLQQAVLIGAAFPIPSLCTPINRGQQLVVVGSGAAGLSAAQAALDHGLKNVLIIESEPVFGGSSIVCGGQFSVAGTEMQASLGIPDTETLFIDDLMKAGKYQNNRELVIEFVKEIKRRYTWLRSKAIPCDPPASSSGMSLPRSHRFNPVLVMETLRQEVLARGCRLEVGIRAQKLKQDNHGKVVGVWAKRYGKSIYIDAPSGVILCSGGFSRNDQLMKKFAPDKQDVLKVSSIGSRGDGLLMGVELGAALACMNNVTTSYGFLPKARTVWAFTWIYYSGGIILNRKGHRFIDESLPYKEIGEAALRQNDPISFILFDDEIRHKQMMKRQIDRHLWEPFDKGECPSYVYSGENIESVAVKAGLDPLSVKETVTKYNEFIKLGSPINCRRDSLSFGYGKPVEIKNPPFFIAPSCPGIFATYCGLKINKNCQVINTSGNTIEGLFAAGEVTGGLHGEGFIVGTGWGSALALGYIAGRAASLV